MTGFSLLELTIVMLILTLILGLFLTSRLSQQEKERRDLTLSNLDAIEKALLLYRQVNHRLPCPADPTLTIASVNYGREVRAGAGGCVVSGVDPLPVMGDVPTKSMGMADEFLYDGWGRRFRYAVVNSFAANCSMTDNPITPTGYDGLVINDEAGNEISDKILVVVQSYGPNGHGAYTQAGVRYSSGSTNDNEHENCDCDEDLDPEGTEGTFVQQLYTQTTDMRNQFDDVLMYYGRENLLSKEDVDGTTETCP